MFKSVDVNYVQEAIYSNKYKRYKVTPNISVCAECLSKGDHVVLIDYDKDGKEDIYEYIIETNNLISIKLKTEKRFYSNIIESVKFYKSFHKVNNKYTSIKDELYFYEVNENILINNDNGTKLELYKNDLITSNHISYKIFEGIHRKKFEDFYLIIN